MRKLLLAAILTAVVAAPALAAKPGDGSQSPPVYRFVGYTVGAYTVDANFRLSDVASECQALFGTDAKPAKPARLAVGVGR